MQNRLTAMAANEPMDIASDEPLDGAASSQHAYDQLRRKILSGELAPGTAFSQVQLATQLGISRTPLREAVRRLQSEGLLRSEHNRRVRVSPLSTGDFEDLYAMRIALDSLAAKITVPQLTEVEIAALREAFDLATEAADRGDLARYHEPHRRFHYGLYAHAGPRLIARVEDLWDHADRYRLLYQAHAGERTYLVQLASVDHAAILEAAEQGDAELCARRIAAHLARTALMTMVRVDHGHDPARVRGALELVRAYEPTVAGPAKESGEGADIDVLGYLRDARSTVYMP
jgi:DNA-binding GntR family transcriptional regulator